jgi:hypothetical protein
VLQFESSYKASSRIVSSPTDKLLLLRID